MFNPNEMLLLKKEDRIEKILGLEPEDITIAIDWGFITREDLAIQYIQKSHKACLIGLSNTLTIIEDKKSSYADKNTKCARMAETFVRMLYENTQVIQDL